MIICICPAIFLNISSIHIELWPLFMCRKLVILQFSDAKCKMVHIFIHLEEQKKLIQTFQRYPENFTPIYHSISELWPLPFLAFSAFFYDFCLLTKRQSWKNAETFTKCQFGVWCILKTNPPKIPPVGHVEILRSKSNFMVFN